MRIVTLHGASRACNKSPGYFWQLRERWGDDPDLPFPEPIIRSPWLMYDLADLMEFEAQRSVFGRNRQGWSKGMGFGFVKDVEP